MTVPSPVVEWASDKGPYELVDTYANLTGASGAYVSTPDSAAVSVTGDIEIVVRVMLTDWTPSAANAMVGKFAAGSRDYWFEVRTDGKVKFGWSSDGATLLEAVSTVATGFSDGLTYWLKVTRNSSTGTVTFSYASDFPNEPTSWTGLGASVATAPSAMNNGTSPLWLGGLSGGTSWLSGRVYQATIRNGINGTTVAEFHADRDSIPGSSTFVSSTTGETWTFNGAASRVSDWVDLTDYVQDGSVQVGRQYELDRFNAGTGSVTLVATSRLFDPDNTTGTYYGKLVPMRQMRIRMRRSSQVWPTFRGYVTDWGQVVPAADRAVYTTVRLADAFALLDATAAPSPYESAVLAKSPTAYFRLHDTNSIPARQGSGSGVWSSTPTLTTPLIVNDASRSWSAAGGIYGKISGLNVTSLNTCVEFWMSTTASSGVIIDANAFGIRVLFHLVAGRLRVLVANVGATSGTYYETTNVVNTGTAQNIYFNFQTNQFTINGVTDAGTSAVVSADELGGVAIETNVWYLGTNQARTYPYVGVLDELAIYSTNVGANYTVGTTPWSGQTTGARVTAILDAIDWPASLRDIDTGDSTMQAFDAAGQSALAAVQQAADTELGQTYVDAYGRVTHRARSALWMESRSKVSQLVVCDAYGAPGYVSLPGASGAYVSTPDSAAVSVTGDLDLRVDLSLTDWTPSASPAVLSKWDVGGLSRSYHLLVFTTGELRFQWANSGGTITDRFSGSAVPFGDGTRGQIRVTLDVDNGAAGHDVKFWTRLAGTDLTANSGWTQLGSTTTIAGTSSVFDGTASVGLGSTSGTVNMLNGRVYQAAILNGINGTVVAKFDARVDGRIGASTFVSSTTGETWTVNGTATLVEESNVEYAADGFALVRDETLLRNPVSASRQNGTTITASDTTQITKYGQRAWSAPLSYDSSDNVINDRATFLLNRYKELATRIENAAVPLHRDPATATPLIGARQIGDRVTVYRRPLNLGGRVVVDQIVEGMSHRFAPQVWTTALRTSPVETTVFLILDDATYGQLDEEALAY